MKLSEYFIKDDGQFPNSPFPVLVYRKALKLPLLFRGRKVKSLAAAMERIDNVTIPVFDPVSGKNGPMVSIWKKYAEKVLS